MWIPCTLEQYSTAKHAVTKNNWLHNDVYTTKGGTNGEGWRDNYTPEDNTKTNFYYKNYTKETEEKEKVEKMINDITANWEKSQPDIAADSIEQYSGFYIARYEAGVPREADFYVPINSGNFSYDSSNRGSLDMAGLEKIKNLSPVSQKGLQAWNFITQSNAKIVAENMFKESESVNSYLVDSQAWNHICSSVYGNNEGETGKSITDSTVWGNYRDNQSMFGKKTRGMWANHGWKESPWTLKPATNYRIDAISVRSNTTAEGTDGLVNIIEMPTGSDEAFKNYNIYDMAGNMWEWTTEHTISEEKMYSTIRGRKFPVIRDELACY